MAALALGAISAQAQVTVQGSKFSDNWSLGLKGGAVTPAKGHSFWQNCRGIFGLELKKQITPVFGLGIEGEWEGVGNCVIGYPDGPVKEPKPRKENWVYKI